MNSKQMKKWLEQQGATFQPGKGSHLKVFLNGKQSSLPMHGARKPLPVASQPASGQKTVLPSALECAKLGVYQAMTDQGIKKAELARRLGWHMPQVDRLFDLRHASKLDQIEAAANVLGKHVYVQIA